ncbi:MAG: S8 family serine peptidase, partial [Pyrinomonadaceae bacterium]|nr:S8 family serine peptidase [Pyrinomonadaceae bacterium]
GPIVEDPDPIDFEGHGTHVADIIGGRSNDGAHKGVAPGASLLAVKVCSAVSTSCSGVASLKGMDFALDPNGDGDISDAVDVINMSLGRSYGQKEDDLSEASANAVRSGVVVVVSAGNSADRPYIVGSPSTTPEVISVAQTQVPSASIIPLVINSPPNIAGTYPNTATLDWAPIGDGFTGDVVFIGRGCTGDTYLANPAGKVALIDRGVCSISQKVDRAAKAGAIGVLIGLIAPGDAIPFSRADGDTFVPTLVIIQSYANLIKANIGAPVNVTVSPANAISLAGSFVSSSSRGPSYSYNAIKPDIGAPGGSVSAEAGTGDGETPFGGTSGAAPMVAGSAALLLDQDETRAPVEIKSLLMNTAETDIKINPATQPGVLAPITRIGGGEVRVNAAFNSRTAAWDAEDQTGSLSFGYHALAEPRTFRKTVIVRNYSESPRIYSITPNFRYADDEASGAVSIITPPYIAVRGNDSASFTVRLRVDASKLPTWNLNGGASGGNGSLLQGVEFDGYINITDARETVHLAWHILPHKAAEVRPSSRRVNLTDGTGSLELSNEGGAVDGRVNVFSLTGVSRRLERSLLPQPGDNFAINDLKLVGARLVGIGGGQFGIQFAINTFGERAHPNYPAGFQIYIDADRDGTDDFVVFNRELGGFAVTGQNVVAVFNLATGTASNVGFFTDADLNSANIILTTPLSAIGLTPTTQFRFSVLAVDNYFTGALTDSIEGMTYTAGVPRY